MNFAYHLPNLWTDRFTHVNVKQVSFSFQWTLGPGYLARTKVRTKRLRRKR